MFSKLQKRRHSFSSHSSLGKEKHRSLSSRDSSHKSRPNSKLTSSISLMTVSEEATQHTSMPSRERRDVTSRRRSLKEILKLKKHRKVEANGTEQNFKVRKVKKSEHEAFLINVMSHWPKRVCSKQLQAAQDLYYYTPSPIS